MRTVIRSVLAAAALAVAGGALLGGCADADGDRPASPPATTGSAGSETSTQSDPAPTSDPTARTYPSQPGSPGTPAQPTSTAFPPVSAVERAPLGLEIRYVDDDGRFVTVAPEDFPR
jgi:hypothetical protein